MTAQDRTRLIVRLRFHFMKSYLKVNPNSLDKDNARRYKAFYRGIVESIRAERGALAPIYFARDMAVLAMVFTDLYDLPDTPYFLRRRGVNVIINEATAYLTNINVTLAYSAARFLGARRPSFRLRKSARSAYLYIPEKAINIERNIEKIAASYSSYVVDPDTVGGYFASIASEAFGWKDDRFNKDLSDLGYYIGKFFFFYSSYKQMDIKKTTGIYNPLAYSRGRDPEVFDAYIMSNLQSLMDEILAILEKLPLSEVMEPVRTAVSNTLAERYEQLKPESKGSKKSKGKRS